MKKLGLTALLLSAGLFVVMGTTSLNAGDMKCGAGKCGASMKSKTAKCGGKCGGEKKANVKCGDDKKESTCCPEKKELKKTAKCGKGKCS